MWTKSRREAPAREAASYDVLIVDTVQQCAGGSSCRVVPAVEVEGIMNVVPTVHFPFTVRLTVTGVTPVQVSQRVTSDATSLDKRTSAG